jgi:hypothetical protein
MEEKLHFPLKALVEGVEVTEKIHCLVEAVAVHNKADM